MNPLWASLQWYPFVSASQEMYSSFPTEEELRLGAAEDTNNMGVERMRRKLYSSLRREKSSACTQHVTKVKEGNLN